MTKQLTNLTIKRSWFLYGAVIIYGLGGSPMPNSINLPLLLTAVLIIIFIGTTPFYKIISNKSDSENQEYLKLFLVFIILTLIGLTSAINQPATYNDLVRDFIPHLFLFLPIFMIQAKSVKNNDNLGKVIPIIIALAGSIISIRFIGIVSPDLSKIGSAAYRFDNFLMLAFDPTVTFAAIYFPIYALENNFPNKIKKIPVFTLIFSLGLAGLAANAVNVSRGPLALCLASYMLYAFQILRTDPKKFLVLAISVIAIAMTFSRQVIGAFNLALSRMVSYGDNGRFDEINAVLKSISGNPITSLIGHGWGGLLENELMYGSIMYSYTHNVFSYYLLKTGSIGLGLIIIYFFIIGKKTASIFNYDRSLFWAGSSALFYNAMFQPTYKSLTFGLIIFAILASSQRNFKQDSQY